MRGQQKVCLITGASSGIGREVALQLARQDMTVVMVCRNESSAAETRETVAAQTGNNSVETLVADLSRQGQIRRLTGEFQARYQRLHLLVNNAGATFASRTLTEDRVESTFAVNAVAPFLLTELLADTLKHSAPSRIINVASGMLARIDWEDVSRRDRQYRQMTAYAQSKMAVVLLARCLANQLKPYGVTAISMTPGMIRDTGLGRQTRGGLKLFLTLMYPFMRTPQVGAADIVDLALRPEGSLTPGGFYKRIKLEQPKGLEDERNRERVFKLLNSLVRSPIGRNV